jgi:hypothetical protein
VNCGVHTKEAGTTTAGGLIARAANRRRAKDREAAGVLSAAQRRTLFLDSARMTAVALSRASLRKGR